jgi:hypothetical protein
MAQDLYEVTDPETAAKKKAARTHGSRWIANLHNNATDAINYANHPPLSRAGEIVFNIRDNGQVWTFSLEG